MASNRTRRTPRLSRSTSRAERWEVIPGFITGRGGPDVFVYDIPAPGGGWIDTSPAEHLNYVNECNQLPDVKGRAKPISWRP